MEDLRRPTVQLRLGFDPVWDVAGELLRIRVGVGDGVDFLVGGFFDAFVLLFNFDALDDEVLRLALLVEDRVARRLDLN